MFPRRLLTLLCLLLAVPQIAHGYALNGYSWPDGSQIVMHLGLTHSPSSFPDGTGSWNGSASDALSIWNQYLIRVQFVAGDAISPAPQDGANSAFFSNNIYGQTWGINVLAVTLRISSQGSYFTETDVIFNNKLKWSSYRGALIGSGSTGTYDFHRVALHEFGHTLGLDHPDEHGQTVTAIMNSITSDLDQLAADDIAGAESLYGNSALSVYTGSSFSYQVVGPAGTTSYASSDLPPGLTLDTSSGIITGIPTISGSYTVHVTAFTSASSKLITFQLTVTPPPPVIGGSVGTLLAKLDLSIGRIVADPNRPRVYVTLPDSNSVAVIDTGSLAVSKTIFIGSHPQGLAVSADGSKLWVANSGSTTSAISVLDLNSLTTLPAIPAPNSASSVVEGLGGRLYATTPSVSYSNIMEIDSKSGVLLGSFGSIYNPLLAISPDRQTLFAADQGLSPSSIAKYDVSTATATLLQHSDFNRTGSNGEDLKVSHDGTFLCFPNGAGNGQGGSYSTSKIPTSNLNAYDGVFNTGAYPGPIAFSNDDTLAYQAAASQSKVYIFDTHTFLPLGNIPLGSNPNDSGGYNGRDLCVDNTGALIFVGTSYYPQNGDLRIYATGHQDPTPTVTPPPKSLLNISTRLRTQTGDNVLIGGFIISGIEPKKILIKASGPSLPVTNTVADPLLELHDSKGALLATNDNWNEHRSDIMATGRAPGDEHEAALVVTLQPGVYTAIVRGVGGTTGVALMEAFDLSLRSNSQLTNISTRGRVETNDNVMIGGFIISPDQPTKVLVRALGPSLADSKVSGVLDDTTLELHDNNGNIIATNDDWQTDQQQEILATNRPPPDPREAALVETLQPGVYTAIVRGKNNATGVALVEVFNLESN